MTVQSARMFLEAMQKVRLCVKANKPRFTHKLSYEEQRLLSADEAKAYCDWIFRRNEKVCLRRERPDPNAECQKDYDNERAAMGYLPGEWP